MADYAEIRTGDPNQIKKNRRESLESLLTVPATLPLTPRVLYLSRQFDARLSIRPPWNQRGDHRTKDKQESIIRRDLLRVFFFVHYEVPMIFPIVSQSNQYSPVEWALSTFEGERRKAV